MLKLKTTIIAALSLTIGVAHADTPSKVPAVPVTAQPVQVLTGTVIESTGASDMHGGWVEVHLTSMPVGHTTSFSDIVFPDACTEPGSMFHIVFEGTSTTIICGEPVK